jgi:hypothetical protein
MYLPLDAPAIQEAGDWLVRADEDLQVPELTLRASPSLLGSSAYHCQQAAEKALKAFLAAHQVALRLTHDLVEHEGQCRAIDALGLATRVSAAVWAVDYGLLEEPDRRQNEHSDNPAG